MIKMYKGELGGLFGNSPEFSKANIPYWLYSILYILLINYFI